MIRIPGVDVGTTSMKIGAFDESEDSVTLGIKAPGETMNVNRTCEITLVCLPKCYPSRDYNIRCHAVSEPY